MYGLRSMSIAVCQRLALAGTRQEALTCTGNDDYPNHLLPGQVFKSSPRICRDAVDDRRQHIGDAVHLELVSEGAD